MTKRARGRVKEVQGQRRGSGAKSRRKSAGKSALGTPFQAGKDPRRGRGPKRGAPNAGRPTNAVRELLRTSSLEEAVPLLRECVRGDAVVKIKLPDGTETGALQGAAMPDRLRAAETILKYGVGAEIEVGGDDVAKKPRTFLHMFGMDIEL